MISANDKLKIRFKNASNFPKLFFENLGRHKFCAKLPRKLNEVVNLSINKRIVCPKLTHDSF